MKHCLVVLCLFSSLLANGQSTPFDREELELFGVSENCQLDTVLSLDINSGDAERHSYFYDGFGGELEAIITQLKFGPNWINSLRREFSTQGGFVPGGYSKVMIEQYWDELSSAWVNSTRERIYFDSQDRLTDEIEQIWSTDSAEWWNHRWQEYNYDPQSGLVSSVLEKVGEYSGGGFIYEYDWEESALTQYDYDGNDSLILKVIGAAVDSAGYLVYKTIEDHSITRNGGGFETVYLTRIHNEDTTAMVNDYRTQTSYNSNDQVTSYTNQYWDSGWNNAYRESWVYNGFDSVVEFIMEDDYGNGWESDYEIHYWYNYANYRDTVLHYYNDGNGLVPELREAHYYTQNWQTSAVIIELPGQFPGDWNTELRYEYQYDAFGNITEFIEQYWDAGWVDESDMHFSYTCGQITDVTDAVISINEPLLYPNPAQNSLNISNGDSPYVGMVQLYSTDGRLVMNEATTGNIDISQLNSGYYLLRFETDGQPTHARFVKQ